MISLAFAGFIWDKFGSKNILLNDNLFQATRMESNAYFNQICEHVWYIFELLHSFLLFDLLLYAGHQFRAHKAVLAACSQFFYKFFQDFTQEPLVEIEGMLCFSKK